MCVYIFGPTDMSTSGERGTLSAQQDCRLEWTLSRSEQQTHTETRWQYVSWQGKSQLIEGQPLTLAGQPLLADGRTERTLMHNEYITARPVCHRAATLALITTPPPASSRPLPQSPAVGDGESLRQFAAFLLSCVCRSCHIRSLSQVICVCVCVCPYATLWLSSLSHTHTQKPPTGGRGAAGNLDRRWSVSWVSVLSWWDDRAVTHVWMTCRLWEWSWASEAEPSLLPFL